MGEVLALSGVSRVFGDDFVAVDGVSFSVSSGEILGLLGPNGAGKTTIVRMCSTLLSPTSGHIVISGVDAVAKPRLARKNLGVALGGSRGFYMKAKVKDNLLFFADIDGLRYSERKMRVAEVLDLVHLTEQADKKVENLSMGLMQRLHLARSLLKKPKLLLLDEPTNGLDPEIALEFLQLVSDISARGTGIVLTTHTLVFAESLVDRIVMLQAGKIAVSGTVHDLAHRAGLSRVIVTTVIGFLAPELVEQFASLPEVISVEQSFKHGITTVLFFLSPQADMRRCENDIRHMIEIWSLDVTVEIYSRAPSLEESYLALVHDARSTMMSRT